MSQTWASADIIRTAKFPAYRAQMRGLSAQIHQQTNRFDPTLAATLVMWAKDNAKITADNELFSDPIPLVKTLVNLVGATPETVYASILYPAMRPEKGAHFDATYLDKISNLFRGPDGVVAKKYAPVRDVAINALQIRACALISPPHSITNLEEAFDKPNAKQAKDLAAYFVMIRATIKDEGAFAIRAAQWYLRLVDMREHPERYTQDDRLNAYYYTDKVYAPLCEYMALKQLNENPFYSPLTEGKGFYRLKTAMDEELIRQINPLSHALIQKRLLGILMGFEIEKGHPADRSNLNLFDRVRQDVEEKLGKIIEDAGIANELVHIQARVKSARSVYQKVRAGRTDIHDYVGFRIIIDIDKWTTHRKLSASENVAERLEVAKCLTGRIHAAIATSFKTVQGRHRNLYTKPYDPDNGYRAVQNTFKFFGQDVEIQIVDSVSHVNNCIGTASHFFHRLVGEKKGERKSGISVSEMMTAFSQAGQRIVVRTEHDLFVLKPGATAATLARKIHQKLLARATAAVITDHDPTHVLDEARVPLDTPLRNGQQVFIESIRPRGLE